MDKQVIKTMFADFTVNDPSRPLLRGIHFENERCYASDTHVLAIYNHGNPKHNGKTITIDGEELNGKYPAVDRVIPKKKGKKLSVDFTQLLKACQWWSGKKDSHHEDRVVIEDTCICIKMLRKFLNLFAQTYELRTAQFFSNGTGKALVGISEEFTALVMPLVFDEEDVDNPRQDDNAVTLSYANLINTFALERSKPKEKKPEVMSWL